MLTVHILASGSEGNSLLVSGEGTHVLLDAGISARRITAALRELGLSPRDLSGVLLTHEHSDHVSGLATLVKQDRPPLYATVGTARAVCRRVPAAADVLRAIPRQGTFDVGDIRVTVFPTSHDAAESVDYRFDCGGSAVGVLTDTGCVPPAAEDILRGVGLMVLESNHDVEWLLSGPYPLLSQAAHSRCLRTPVQQRRRFSGAASGGLRNAAIRSGAPEPGEQHAGARPADRVAGAQRAGRVRDRSAPRSAQRPLRGGGVYMQRVTVLCVGKLKEKFYTDAAAEYVKRLQRYCKLDVVELPECRLPEEPSPAEIQKALQTEGAAIRERLPRGGAVVALCIEGKPCSSEELSRRIIDFGVQGKTQITFLIGGSVGLDEGIKKQADWRLSMSPMTFPHHMARIMLLEQIYRAYQIAAGTKYHK